MDRFIGLIVLELYNDTINILNCTPIEEMKNKIVMYKEKCAKASYG